MLNKYIALPDSFHDTTQLDPPSTTHQVIMLVVYSVMFLFSLSGNSLTIYIVVTKPYMRSVTNCLIANMAVADLFMTLSAMPYSAAYAYVGGRWFGGTMGMITCKILHFSVALSIAASILTLVVIALDRFFAVVFPFKRPSVIRKISVVSTVIWVLSILSTSPYLYYYKALLLEDGNYHCFVSWEPVADSWEASRIYFSFVFIFLYVIPLFIIAVFYSIMCFKLWSSRIPGNPTAANLRHAATRKRRTIKMMIIIVIVFALCWLPAHLMHLFIFFYEETYYEIPVLLRLISFGVSHANSAINPYLYIALNRNFRRAYVDVLQSCCSPAGTLVRSLSRGSNMATSSTNQGMSTQYAQVAGLGRREVYELSTIERDRAPSSVKQISLMKKLTVGDGVKAGASAQIMPGKSYRRSM
ncbi:hypothetical protein OS493_031030 [Desmophyllum pertusum]|uniref:G-protein coupled receptors family 1 profile domain-containing protein n=1 Tax=Desmophyllum pertusum TaxID=174260 RepID=A0A9W9Z8D3_9CNID|nr:hypothetical protein OS493_031030 [Desmophyllum pertusum]